MNDDNLRAECDELRAERDQLRAQLELIRPGHFYSPIPSYEDVQRNEARLSDRTRHELMGVELDLEGQLKLLGELEGFYTEQPFSDEPQQGLRYYFMNDFYSYSDAIFLYTIMRLNQPRRIIEVGSGFSSFVMMDTNELFLDGNVKLTFIEPHTERLQSRLKASDLAVTEIVSKPVQEVGLELFNELSSGDILFIDSSHVSKVGSDVNCVLFEILPSLAKGVWVHFHDMFYPFEYPKQWIENGVFWNEDYIMRAFLQYNSNFRIRVWNAFLGLQHPDKLRQHMPLCMKNIGASLWLQRFQ